MAPLEINKIVAGVLIAAVTAMVFGFAADYLVKPEVLDEPAYKVAGLPETGTPAVDETTAAAETEAPDPAQDPAQSPDSVLALLATADPVAGQAVAKKCKACHSFNNGGPNKIGPNLWGIVGRTIASKDGFSYSQALKDRAGETWGYENLDSFLTRPKAFAPGTKMSFAGIKKAGQRAALIAYLRSLSDSPVALPE